jgi:hypothetical protein
VRETEGDVRDIWLGGFGLILAACLIFFSLPYPLLAKLWVYFVATGFIAIPSLLLLRSSWAAVHGRSGLGQHREPSVGLDRKLLFQRGVLLVAFLIFLGLIPPLGFVLSTVVFVFGLALYFERKPLPAVVAGVAVAGFIWMMKTGFGFYLPTGMFDL